MADIVFAGLVIVSVLASYYCLMTLWDQRQAGKIDSMSTLFLSVAIVSFSLFVVLLYMLKVTEAAKAREGIDYGNDRVTAEWYRNLMRPDEGGSCCGDADAYWCEPLFTKIDASGIAHNYCTITDDRPDAPRYRPHIDIGTPIEVPNAKLKWGPRDPDKHPSNPTGHGIVFISPSRYVLCYVQNSGT